MNSVHVITLIGRRVVGILCFIGLFCPALVFAQEATPTETEGKPVVAEIKPGSTQAKNADNKVKKDPKKTEKKTDKGAKPGEKKADQADPTEGEAAKKKDEGKNAPSDSALDGAEKVSSPKASQKEPAENEAKKKEAAPTVGKAKAPGSTGDAKKDTGSDSSTVGMSPAENAIAEADRRAKEKGLPPELVELSREVAGFESQVRDYRSDVKRVVNAQYKRRREFIEGRYNPLIAKLTEIQRQRRMAAVKRFEVFLAKYPNDAKYTPDALFRLADLYFEQVYEEHDVASEKYQDLMTAFDEGKLTTEPVEPKIDYTKVINLFDRLVTNWPEYRSIDGAYYLRGYCLAEMGKVDEAKASFELLVKRLPKSRYAPQAWMRIGEYYFDTNKLKKAIAVYRKMLEYKDHRLYDSALYKLAWTYFRDDQYEEAIAKFRALVEFSDEKVKKMGGEGSDLRKEAIRYLAISLQEEDWDGDGERDVGAGFPRVMTYVRGDRSYDVEVLRAIADIFLENSKYEEAVATIRHLLKHFPNDPNNPELHYSMITAYNAMRRYKEAFEERDRLARAYGAGTEWHRANKDKQEVISAADKLMQKALSDLASYHHSEAQRLKGQLATGGATTQEVMREYGLAAEAYEKYLAHFPSSPNVYDLNFRYAECLYWSTNFARAAIQFARVRDSKRGKKHTESAAHFSIASNQDAIEILINGGKLASRPSLVSQFQPEQEAQGDEEAQKDPEDENDGLVKKIEPEPIPDEVLLLLDSLTKYVELGLSNSDDKARRPNHIYKLGEVYFDYKHYEKSRKWLAILIKKYPKQKVTRYAAERIIETYQVANDWKKMAEWAEKIDAAGLGREFDEKIRTMRVGALFQGATRLQGAGKLKEAAEEYVRLVDTNPGNKYAAQALNNAAIAYEDLRRFESATRTYERIYREYPKSPFVEDAMFRVGINSEKFYDYDKAINTHLDLVRRFPNSNTHRADSLYTAAKIQEWTQQYRKAAKNFERYAQIFPNRKDTAQTYFRAGETYRKLKDTRNEIRIYERFAREFGSDPVQNTLVIQGLARIAEIYQTQGKRRNAERAWRRVIDEFNRRGMQVGTFEAQHPARATFELVELEFGSYERLKLIGSLKNQGRVIKELQRKGTDLKRRYAEVLQYKSNQWSIAALYRDGHVLQLFADALAEAPVPESLNEEQQDMYRVKLEEEAGPIEDEAVKKFVFAHDKAREFRMTNEWTKRVRESLYKYRPSEYPRFREEKRMKADRQLTTPRMIQLIDTNASEPSDSDANSDSGSDGETPQASGDKSVAPASPLKEMQENAPKDVEPSSGGQTDGTSDSAGEGKPNDAGEGQ